MIEHRWPNTPTRQRRARRRRQTRRDHQPDVVSKCRKAFNTRRCRHAGTLDPMATGVLVVGIERATKLLGLLS